MFSNDQRVQFLQNTLRVHGNTPWQSDWLQVPRELQAKTHKFAQYITKKNFERYRNRDKNLTYHRLLSQTTRGYMGEMFFYVVYGQYNDFMMPDWYRTPEEEWPNMKVNWAPDHTAEVPAGCFDRTVGFEDKTGRDFDPGWAIQWSSSDRRSRKTANRMPLAYGAVGPNYFMTLIECHHNKHLNEYWYRVAAIVRGIDLYNHRDLKIKGKSLIGVMDNGNRHKKQLSKSVLYESRLEFFCPRWFQGPQVWLPPRLKSCLKQGSSRIKRRVTFGLNQVHRIQKQSSKTWAEIAR